MNVPSLRAHAFGPGFCQGHAAKRAFFRLLLTIAVAAPGACSCSRRQSANQIIGPGGASANNDGRRVVASADVDGDGRLDKLLTSVECGTQGCLFELERGAAPRGPAVFSHVAKSCRILDTRSAGHSDIECVQIYWVEAEGGPWVRAMNRYHWTGTSYVSPLDQLGNEEQPETPAACSAVQLSGAADVLLLPASEVRVSRPRGSDASGWSSGPARTPVVATLQPGARVPALAQVTSPEGQTWLRVRIAENVSGWLPARQTVCVKGGEL